eukprot:CAMPEP_0114627720 /NCGR_PEP_ID=MMETSP0168-20121206/12445_1 /TAXON_ID=95228 ORGANISM="Vannella sp., Strain DIVA3 517/6/12" /NCGR_SAMPLE_ID=MMETSP0168 /ASSEMBLY_ACC=CAM_ASM_000044 /LENGTH=442 /DNA_ID=CAMNT_0001839069 /DNA_START=148 /DNA_END=1476 /DNA_ORIENTATION=+
MRSSALLLCLAFVVAVASAADDWKATPAAVDRHHKELYFATNDLVPWVGKSSGQGNGASLVASLPLPVASGTLITAIRATASGLFVLISAGSDTYPMVGRVQEGGNMEVLLTLAGSGLASAATSLAVDEENAVFYFTAMASDKTWGLFSLDYSRSGARVEPVHALARSTRFAGHLQLRESTLYFMVEAADGSKEVRSLQLGSAYEDIVTQVPASSSSMKLDDQGQLWIVQDRKDFLRCSVVSGCAALEVVRLVGDRSDVMDFVVVSDKEVFAANSQGVASLKAPAYGYSREDPPVLQPPYGNNDTNGTLPTMTATATATPTMTPSVSDSRSSFPSITPNFTIATMLPSRSTNHSIPFPVPSVFSRSYTPIITASNTAGLGNTNTTESPRSPIITTEGWELIGVFAAIAVLSLAICLFCCWKRTVTDEMAMSLRLPDSPDDFL